MEEKIFVSEREIGELRQFNRGMELELNSLKEMMNVHVSNGGIHGENSFEESM